MKLHRDAPAELAPPPRFSTSAPPVVTWRSDLIQVAIASVVTLVVGFFVTVTIALFAASWTALGVGLWLAVGGALVPFLVLAYMILRELADRHTLNRARHWAEIGMLQSSWLDVDEDGELEQDELDAFVRYVRQLHRGAPTTARQAQQYGVDGPTWQKYRNALVSIGLAYSERKRGGSGFELMPSMRATPWPNIEQHVREKAGLLMRPADSPGMLITTPAPKTARAKPPIVAVSTLGADMED